MRFLLNIRYMLRCAKLSSALGSPMLWLAFGAVSLSSPVMAQTSSAHSDQHRSCFTGDINMRIPVGKHYFNGSGLNETEYNQVLDQVEKVYKPIFSEHGLEFRFDRNWKMDYIGAAAEINDAITQLRTVTVYGGLARHPKIDQEALTAVVCHEIGHHLGGAPKLRSSFLKLITLEGQADYFAALKCLRKVFANEDNVAFLADKTIPDLVKEQCAKSFSNETELALCARVSLAGEKIAQFLAEITRKKTGRNMPDPQFATPSTDVVDTVLVSHPNSQCRLDTFFQGALCPVNDRVSLDDEDPARGACSESQGDQIGLRPKCWWSPSPKTILL